MLNPILNPTGGLGYHARAMRFRNNCWSDFRTRLNRWLMDWNPRESKLLLIGPSAGYCLERRFLDRFPEISAVDPDPLARVLFGSRFKRKVRWEYRDYFSPRRNEFEVERTRILLDRYADHAILFCNLLGQVRFLNDDAAEGSSFMRWKGELAGLLRDRSWASFHDRLSGSLRPVLPETSRLQEPPKAYCQDRIDDSEILRRMYPPVRSSKPVELEDHMTGDLFPGHPRCFFSWELVPGTFHLVEAVRNPD